MFSSSRSLSRLNQEVPRSEQYRTAVQPQLSREVFTKDGKPIRKKKKIKKIKMEDYEDLKSEVEMVEHKCSLVELAERLGVNFETGISMDRAKYTLERDGPNELSPPKTTPEWVKFSKHLFNPFSLLLWISSVLSFIVFSVNSATREIPRPEDLYLGFVLVGVIIVNSCFSYFMEVKTTNIIQGFKDLSPQFATVYRKGEKMNIHSEELVVGDIVELKGGDKVPADIRLIVTKGLKVDNSSLTGESEIKVRTTDYTNENPLETRNLVFYSTSVIEGVARGIVVGTGDRTLLGRIAKLAGRMEISKESLVFMEMKHIMTNLALLGTVVSFLFFFIALIDDFFWLDALRFLAGIIVACVPEGLFISIGVCFIVCSMKLSKKNCSVRDLQVIHTFSSANAIVTDKSGVLTTNKPQVSRMWFDNQIFQADFSSDQAGAQYNRTMPSWMALARSVMLSNKTPLTPDNQDRIVLGDPLDVALIQFMEIAIGNTYDFRMRNKKICQIDFNKSIKYQVSIHEMDDPRDRRYLLVMTGAPERVFDRCNTILINGEEKRISSQWRLAFHNAFLSLGENGETVIGVVDMRLPSDKFPLDYPFDADQENFPQTGLRFLGMVSVFDPPKPSVPMAITKCKSAGIKVVMVTGDHPITAKAVARGLGIISERSECADDIAIRLNIPVSEVNQRDPKACVVHGSDLRDLNFSQMQKLINNYDELIFARTSPHQKLIIVEALQNNGLVVVATGNGINDTPSIKKADIGIAMGINGTELSKQAADAILLDDNFASIVTAIEEGRLLYNNIKKLVLFTLVSNFTEVCAFLIHIIFRVPLPLGALTILFIDLGTNLMPGLSLVLEEEEFENEVMRNPPKDVANHRIFNKRLLNLAFGQLGILQLVGAIFTYFAVMAESGWWPARLLGIRDLWTSRWINDLEDAYGQEWPWGQRKVLEYMCQTSFFAAIVMQQWVVVIVSRARKSCAVWLKPNAVLNHSLIINSLLLLFFVYCPGLDRGLRMYPMRFSWFFAPLQFLFFIFVYDEIRKFIIYKYPQSFIAQETVY